MEIKEILTMQKQVKAKLMSAVALLLVSAILLSTSTYAWFVLSTAPEVSEMKTTAGANGALEIALQSTGNLSDIQHGVGDSSVNTGNSLKKSNNTWGNVVDLSGNTYGLDGLALLPARLNIDANGRIDVSSPLVMPQYGIDGRISDLADLKSMYYVDGNFATDAAGDYYGVRMYTDDKSANSGEEDIKYLDRMDLINTTREQILKLRTELRSDLDSIFQKDTNKNGISSILYHTVNLNFDGKNDEGDSSGSAQWSNSNAAFYSWDDYQCIKSLLNSFSNYQEKAATGVRHALLACAAADTTNYPADKDTLISKELSELYAKYRTLPLMTSAEEDVDEDTVYKIAEKNRTALNEASDQENLRQAYESVMKAAEATFDVQNRIQNAQSGLNGNESALKKLWDSTKSGTAEEQAERKRQFSQKVSSAILSLFELTAALKGGVYVTDEINETNSSRTLYDEIQAGTDEKYYRKNSSSKEWESLPARFYMLNGSGLFASIATLAGDFSSGDIKYKLKVNPVTFWHFRTEIRATTAEWPTTTPVWGYEFGYDPQNNTGCLQNVYNKTDALTAEGSVKYVVNTVDKINAYGYAVDLAFQASAEGNLALQQEATDRVTGKTGDAVERLPSTSSTQGAGSMMEFRLYKTNQEYLSDDTNAEKRAADLIQCLRVVFMQRGTGDILGVAAADDNNIELSGDYDPTVVQVKAPLMLYDTANSSDGVLTLIGKREKQSITRLPQDSASGITALVYLDGDAVQSGYLTADQLTSMSGSINLQFGLSGVTLTPMGYSDYAALDGNGA